MYQFSKTASIFETYIEYYEGLGSSISVEKLEEIFQAGWRRGNDSLAQERRRRAAVAGWVKRLIEYKPTREDARRYITTHLQGLTPRTFYDKYLAKGKQEYPFNA